MLEKQIEKAVSTYALEQGWLVYKFVSPSCRGVPDRIFMKDGTVFFIEFKAPTGRLSKLQNYIINKFQMHQMPVFVVDSIDAGCKIIDQMGVYYYD